MSTVTRNHATISAPVNTKLGTRIFSWSLPASAHICVGASGLCRKRCYAKRGYFVMKTAKRAYSKNERMSRSPAFVKWMRGAIRTHFVEILRIHVSGDFYDPAYVDKWYDIVQQCPSVKFFGYTRSWRDDAMLPGLLALGQLPNMQLWWSIDRETGPAPAVRGIRQAYMAIDDIDASRAPATADLVFRVRPKTGMKKANGTLVCPAENKVTPKITCTQCKFCWREPLVQLKGALNGC